MLCWGCGQRSTTRVPPKAAAGLVPPLMNIHVAAAALYPVLCNYHFKGSQMLIRLEHDLKKRMSWCLQGLELSGGSAAEVGGGQVGASPSSRLSSGARSHRAGFRASWQWDYPALARSPPPQKAVRPRRLPGVMSFQTHKKKAGTNPRLLEGFTPRSLGNDGGDGAEDASREEHTWGDLPQPRALLRCRCS